MDCRRKDKLGTGRPDMDTPDTTPNAKTKRAGLRGFGARSSKAASASTISPVRLSMFSFHPIYLDAAPFTKVSNRV